MRPAPPPPLLGIVPPPSPRINDIQAQPEVSLEASHGSSGSNMSSHGIQPTNHQLSLYGPSSSPQTPPLLQPSRSTSTPSNELSDEDALSSDLSDCPDEEEDDDWSPRNRSTGGKKGASRRDQGGQSSSKGDNYRHRWTKSEDRVIIAAVKKHGQSWTAVKADLDRLGGPSRRTNAIVKRYRRLVKHSAEQRKLLANVAASSSLGPASALPPRQQHSRGPQSSLLAYIPADLEWNPRVSEPWTQEESQKLEAICKTTKKPSDVFLAFIKAFPSTTRTAAAVEIRSRRYLPAKATNAGTGSGSNGAGGAQGSVVASLPPQAAEHQGVALSSSSLAPPKRGRGRPRKTPHVPTGATSSMPVSSLGPNARAAGEPLHLTTPLNFNLNDSNHNLDLSLPSAPEAGDSGSDFALQGEASPPLAQQPLPPSSVTDYTVTVTGTGLLVQDLPPLHQLLILSPASYRVVGPQRGTSPSISSHLTAPFVFQAGADASIQALVLPPGTASSIALLPAEPRVGEHLQAARPRSLIERRFVTVDEFSVVFQSTQPSV